MRIIQAFLKILENKVNTNHFLFLIFIKLISKINENFILFYYFLYIWYYVLIRYVIIFIAKIIVNYVFEILKFFFFKIQDLDILPYFGVEFNMKLEI